MKISQSIKSIASVMGLALVIYACDSKTIKPKEVVGEWAHAYQIQTKTANGIWGPWSYISTLTAIPNIEFTESGKYLRDGKPGAECCTAGNDYSVEGTTITFSDIKICPQMSCRPCNQWEIVSIKADTLVLEMCDLRAKLTKVKK